LHYFCGPQIKGITLALLKSLPASLFQREEILASPFGKACLPVGRGDCRRPIGPLARREGDFIVILLISLAFEIHFSKS
jgi:hypothetical protein